MSMFDRLRQQSTDSDSAPETEETPSWMPEASSATEPEEAAAPAPASRRFSFGSGGGGAGLQIPFISQFSPLQRFVLALMIFLLVSEFGCLLLLLTGRLPF